MSARILQITNSFSPNVGGVETHLDDLVGELLARNLSVFVLSYIPLTSKIPSKTFERLGNLTILRLPWFRGPFYKFMASPVTAFLYLTPGLFFALPLVLMTRKIDVIHAHGITAAFAGAIWSMIFRKRFVITMHARYSFTGMFRRVAIFIFNRANKILCLSKHAMEDVQKLGIPTTKIGRFTNWVDLDKFRPLPQAQTRKKLGWSNEFTVLFVGRLVAEKGVQELLKAAKRLNPGIRIVIAGDGPLEPEVQAATKRYPVTYVGKIKNEELAAYFSASDIFINPPKHEESFARVILEALACGTPVIGPNRGEVVEILDKSVSLQIEVTDISIAKTINRLASSPDEVSKLAASARPFVEHNYSSKHVETIMKAYGAKGD